jgi:hypothetical protein
MSPRREREGDRGMVVILREERDGRTVLLGFFQVMIGKRDSGAVVTVLTDGFGEDKVGQSICNNVSWPMQVGKGGCEL